MPDYIWDMVQGFVPDGIYQFPEGTLTISNGYVGWRSND